MVDCQVVTLYWGVSFTHVYLLVGGIKLKFSKYEIYLSDITFVRLKVRFLSLPWQHGRFKKKPKITNSVGLGKIKSYDFLMNLHTGYNRLQ